MGNNRKTIPLMLSGLSQIAYARHTIACMMHETSVVNIPSRDVRSYWMMVAYSMGIDIFFDKMYTGFWSEVRYMLIFLFNDHRSIKLLNKYMLLKEN